VEPTSSLQYSQLPATSPYPEPAPSIHQNPLPLLKVCLNVILSSTSGSPQWSPFLRLPHQHPVHTSPLPHTRHIPRPSNSSWFYQVSHPYKTTCKVIVVCILIFTFCVANCLEDDPGPNCRRHSVPHSRRHSVPHGRRHSVPPCTTHSVPPCTTHSPSAISCCWFLSERNFAMLGLFTNIWTLPHFQRIYYMCLYIVILCCMLFMEQKYIFSFLNIYF
jgi:hypothetical protein